MDRLPRISIRFLFLGEYQDYQHGWYSFVFIQPSIPQFTIPILGIESHCVLYGQFQSLKTKESCEGKNNILIIHKTSIINFTNQNI